ncbi:protein PAT1 homolog 1 [Anastrepha ludens]|uniref:protein PAT1 homolog 1 n=1 Tax=Anastrepha ludens TaxID=28586 RepID=UPI0023AF7F3D|nr:protein PAT1 homolog 1 [Anastrepha ludens]XP_053970047.1 protein PAT1 homolog 1 [Anastrepha ludens]
MDDSFFGFDTSVPFEDDGAGGQIAEPSEEEYDALNDETFGSATNGDWEEAHENMVRLTDCFLSDSGCRDSLDGVRSKGGKAIHSSQASSSKANPLRVRTVEKYADSDLELNLSGMRLDDVDLRFDDNESVGGASGLSLDPSVWASIPLKPSTAHQSNILGDMRTQTPILQGGDARGINGSNDIRHFQRAQIANHRQQTFDHRNPNSDFQNVHGDMAVGGICGVYGLPPTPKFCTLEDIERNIINEQTMRKHQEQHPESKDYQQQQNQNRQTQQYISDVLKQATKTPPPQHIQQQQAGQHQQNLHKPQLTHLKGPPGFPNNQGHPPRPSSNFTNNLAQHPLGNLLQQHQAGGVAGSRLPPGFPLYSTGPGPHLQQQNNHQLPPHPLLNQHGLPPNFQQLHQRPLPGPHLPIALNNFAMHPNFNAMRAAAAVGGIYPAGLVQPQQQQTRIAPHPTSPAVLLNAQQSNSMYNMFNMRLVQEIQQNHPLLQNAARQAQQMQQTIGMNTYQSLAQQRANNIGGKNPSHQRREGGPATGNLPHEEFDEYANLMSTRDKHWLIGIQLSQLNTETPYIDDFYYMVYRERKAAQNGNLRHSQAHKDNQLNHPLTQPKGHAQLILVQLGNKNGTRNGQLRERRNSETTGVTGNNSGHIGNNQDQKSPYVFTPLKFENSLGKLQYGSVTAPRKIIDAEIMGKEAAANGAGDGIRNVANSSGISSAHLKSNTLSVTSLTGIISDIASSAQRKSRHILLHIETLYRIVLKLEDLNNPTAIATIIMKKKKESERIAALEQLENANKTQEERVADLSNTSTVNPALKNKFAYEIEKKEILVSKLIAGLSHEEVPAIMNVRKGKTLIRRIMPYMEDHEIRWNIWMGVFASLQNVVKKDREDVDGVLYALYPEFKKQVREADFEAIVKISSSIPLTERKSNGVFCSKFGISSLVCLVLQAEHIYMSDNDSTHTDANKEKWRHFLDQVSTSLNRTIQNQAICAEIESDSIQPMMDHFARFKDLKLDSLLALITEAKQQIN